MKLPSALTIGEWFCAAKDILLYLAVASMLMLFGCSSIESRLAPKDALEKGMGLK